MTYILVSPMWLNCERYDSYDEAYLRRDKVGNKHWMIYESKLIEE